METKFLIILILFIGFIVFLKISKKIFYFIFFISLSALTFFMISGCGQGDKINLTTSLQDVGENTLTRISDIPFILKSKIDVERSLILGEGKSWSGQLLVYTPLKKGEVFNFYVNNLGDYGWKEQTTIRGETSILNFLGENNRVAIITIKEKRFNSAEVLISVSPFTEDFEEKVGDYINDKYLGITEKIN